MSLNVRPVYKRLKEYEQIKELIISERFPMWFLLWKARSNFADFLALYDDDRFVGVTYLVTSRDLTFVMYLAIDGEIRSKGYGKKALETIQSQHPGNRIILNIEAIEESADNYEQRVKRKFFYTKNGFINTALQYLEGEDKLFWIHSVCSNPVPVLLRGYSRVFLEDLNKMRLIIKGEPCSDG
ncbi:N-acetyltransferase [Paenibacillus oralis]|uniref:N-acetyltransferase n=1 Tax=Paenibacillus oralis TaxID=2490856 RepID=A0A3P3U2T0_9BACL|nr:GNAT family N-acetyltransferase [Paenibacillus oralis]RRJ64635.1 N-acetyltransferase [Paenibacillus oralis]